MADVTLSYKGSDILELSDSGSATLKTGGKYCEDDIDVEYVKPSGGGSPWELIADYTSTENASVVTAEIPSEYQNENVYKIEYTGESRAEYPLFRLNSSQTSYGSGGGISNIKLITYATRLGSQRSTSGESTSAGMRGDSTAVNSISSSYPIESVGIKSYYNDDRLQAGFNIKVWRLVE